ncbi:CRAL-TRIO domain-containing protein [Melanogaster broomeanus]|nr:CRAL-TRIO domain-containing protein [Melanogaster broomeanus]
MSRGIHAILQESNEKLLIQYDTTQSDVSAILATLNQDVLPHLIIELGLRDIDVAWVIEWLNDTASIFRLLRRHKFTWSFALEEIRNVLVWRLQVLRPLLGAAQPRLLHCLPPPIADPLGRPMVFVKISSLQGLEMSVRVALLQEVERLRVHLEYIKGPHDNNERFPLQYVVLVDLEGVSIPNFKNLELFSWLLTDVIPRYPGMLAAVFLLNYSWMHSGVWSIAKRVLPSSALSRVFFPSRDQLLDYCSAATLPAEYGGSLAPLDQIEDPLHFEHQIIHAPPDLRAPSPRSTDTHAQQVPSIKRPPSSVLLPPTSALNPFFGYPVVTSSSTPHIVRQVRRRKRDLLRTLAVLWWQRWGSRAISFVCVCAMVALIATRARLKRLAISWLRLSGFLIKS